jgi:hypothetical protein
VDVANDRSELFDGQSIRSLSAIVNGLLETYKLGSGQEELVTAKICNGWVSANGSKRYVIRGFRVAVPVGRASERLTIAAVDGAAKLLLSDGAGLDFVLWDTVLQGYRVDASGQIHLADQTSQRRLNVTVGLCPPAAAANEPVDIIADGEGPGTASPAPSG